MTDKSQSTNNCLPNRELMAQKLSALKQTVKEVNELFAESKFIKKLFKDIEALFRGLSLAAKIQGDIFEMVLAHIQGEVGDDNPLGSFQETLDSLLRKSKINLSK